MVNNNALWMIEGKGEGFQDLGKDGRQGELDFGEDEEEEDDPEEIKKLEEELAKSL